VCDGVAGEALDATRLMAGPPLRSGPWRDKRRLGCPKRDDGRYEGELRTLSIRAEIAILPVGQKMSPNQPDYRVVSQGTEIGAGWLRKGQTSGKDYVSLSIAAPEFGAKTIYANLGRAAGQSDPDVYALIWSPQD
jgi:uncharacterized protein (DUF736 family)